VKCAGPKSGMEAVALDDTYTSLSQPIPIAHKKLSVRQSFQPGSSARAWMQLSHCIF
jgi:hypothetical protein